MHLLNRPLAEYLKHKLGPDTVLVHDQRFSRGSSRVTWFVNYRLTPDAPVTSVIFRGDHPGGATISTSLEQEYFMYERLSHTDVPIAKPLWWEDDPDWVPRPFYVREKVDGSWNVPHILDEDPQYDDHRIAISKEHIRKLAIVHNVDWEKLGFQERLPAPSSTEDCATNFIDMMMAQLESFRIEHFPLVIEAVDWLRESAPVAPRICLCKGTNGLSEEVFKDGVIVAMSDWEEATIGDPAADFASVESLVPEIVRDGRNIWGMEKAVTYYREVSGIPLSLENVRFYQTVRALGMIIYSSKAATISHVGPADIRQVWTGSEVAHLGKRLLGAAMGLTAPVQPSWFEELNETIEDNAQ